VSGLTAPKFGRRRSSGESSERNCDLHVDDDLESLAMKLKGSSSGCTSR